MPLKLLYISIPASSLRQINFYTGYLVHIKTKKYSENKVSKTFRGTHTSVTVCRIQSLLIWFGNGAFTVNAVGGDATLFCHNARRVWEIINYYEWLQIHDAGNFKQCVIKDSIQATDCQEVWYITMKHGQLLLWRQVGICGKKTFWHRAVFLQK